MAYLNENKTYCKQINAKCLHKNGNEKKNINRLLESMETSHIVQHHPENYVISCDDCWQMVIS